MTGTHKWVIIGGSYPGAMSAWFKSKYPKHVAAAWSSSGVIDAIEEYREYDYGIFNATVDYGRKCPEMIKYSTSLIERAVLFGNKTVR